MLEDALKLRVDVGCGTFSVQVMDVNVFEFTGATSVAQGFDETLRYIRYRTDVDMIARLDDFDGFLGRNCLILLLHKVVTCSTKNSSKRTK